MTTEVRRIDPEVSTPESFLVDVGWSEGDMVCEVADSIDGVRVMDDHGEDVSVEASLRYIEARVAGSSKEAAWRFARGWW
ncbi:hypothetical protein [Actinopolymorpha rutila]|uniref:Uncharacterized protein n=1 Tax=Actinopolymorpha rutila TaxID=446787 RepID=A0A852ZIF4_9ACTN|nr:hypothetical protein [Actinopolymorpha rutila]NYH92891.1 hypothetical protein [Actinopolymorpha rutila]